jgi:hypothetical protein
MTDVTRIEPDEIVIPLADIPGRLHNRVSLRSVSDPEWRRRAGLRVVRLGKKIIGVRPEDLASAMKRGF